MVGERRRTSAVRWSETGERNDAYEAFSAACWTSPCTLFVTKKQEYQSGGSKARQGPRSVMITMPRRTSRGVPNSDRLVKRL
jgi:hypothetical protein